MSTEENLLFQGKTGGSKPSFGDDATPEKTARETAAAMAAMDVSDLIGGNAPTATGASAAPRSLDTMFGTPTAQPPGPKAPGSAATARPKTVTAPKPAAAAPRPAAAAPKPAAAAHKPAAAAPEPAMATGETPSQRGLIARLLAWIFGR